MIYIVKVGGMKWAFSTVDGAMQFAHTKVMEGHIAHLYPMPDGSLL